MEEETTENQIFSPFYLFKFKPYLLCVALLIVPCIVLSSFLDLGLHPILFTIPILVLSTSFLVTFTKKRKVVLVQNSVSRELQHEDEVEYKVAQPVPIETGSDPGIVHEVRSHDMTTQIVSNPELNWMMVSGNVEQNPEISNDSASEEEEGLIEIAIPSSNGSIEEGKEKLQSNLPMTYWPDSIFKQQHELVEVLAEMNEVINEEENLIEIDISMGSIKCSRFEIEA
ncbi:hypothetical protein PTKIN_Ptkin11bG0198000 [Pterospermum kingtungense]